MNWKKIGESLWLFKDSCNVYAVQGPSGIVLINCGTGLCLDHADELPMPIHTILCTHFFRDHTSGAPEAAKRGVEICAPYWEREQFSDPLGLFQRRETFLIYDNIWDLFAPIQPIPISKWLMDWEEFTACGILFQVIPSPGVTIGAVSIACQIKEKRVIFCGEMTSSAGKMSRIAPLQYNYADLPGAVTLYHSCRELQRREIDILAPSMGAPITTSISEALGELEKSILTALEGRPEYKSNIESTSEESLEKVTEHIYKSKFGAGNSWFIISDSGKALAIDYGYDARYSYPCYPFPQHPNYPYFRNRRSMLHGLDGLRESFGIDRIETVIVTHFHDDHISGIPLLQRLFNTRCWAGENFSMILAHPMSYNFPATWPEPINVTPQPLGVPLECGGIHFQALLHERPHKVEQSYKNLKSIT